MLFSHTPVPDMKMLYFIMIVLFQVNQVLVVKNEDLPKDNENFISVINTFHIDIDPENSDNIISGHGLKEGSIEPQVFVTFENNLLLILQQMAFYYSDKEYGVFYTEYIFNVCSLLPRLLDFLYMGSVINSNIILLNRIYLVFCKKLPSFYKNYNEEDISNNNKTHFKEQLDHISLFIQSSVEEETELEKYLYNKFEKYEFQNIKYLSTIYEIIGSINMIPIMKNNPGIQFYDIFINYSQYQNMIIQTPKSLKGIGKNIQRVTDNGFEKINENYIEIIIQNECGELNNRLKEQDLTKPTVIYELMLFTFKRLTNDYLYYISESLNTLNENTEYLKIKNNLLVMLEVTCNYFPLVLMYLIELNINDTNLLSLYLTFCSNSKGFANNVRCSSFFQATIADEGSENNRNCKLESTRNYLMRNILTITDKVSEINKNVYNEVCTKANLDFIKNIHDFVFNEHYEGSTVPVWTTFEWLSGTYFLTDNHSSDDMNEIKFSNMTIKGENMSLSVAYYAIVPWILNSQAIMNFHNTIFMNLKTTMDLYVYQHAVIINLYLKNQRNNINWNAEDKVIKFIRNSFLWYKQGTIIFYEYLNLPYVQGLKNVAKLDSIISVIENINKTNFRDIDILIKDYDVKDNMRQLFDKKIFKSNEIYDNRYGIAIEWNCINAIDFVNSFVLIVNKSMRIEIEFDKEKMKELYCLTHNIFGNKSRVGTKSNSSKCVGMVSSFPRSLRRFFSRNRE
ncbi:Hypothetical protein CINCED_3A018402 [Cinara cedri]|uniref:Uncharacterized protein n=1 Tax=Cinara cedri TaxID=506608 RepID=A0A5E4M1N0_9HEMI|nr:Hypothetical protein CINCED_3A018402 [Cinara cedri]